MRRFGIQFAILVLIVFGTAAVLAGLTDMPSSGQKRPDAGQADEELKLLYSLSEEQATGPLRLTVKLQGEGKLSLRGSAGAEARKLAEAIGLQESAVKENNEDAYRVRGTITGVKVRLDWVQESGRSYVKIQLDDDGEPALEHLLKLQQNAWKAMHEAGIEPSWNASAQGAAGFDGALEDMADQLEKKLGEALKIKRVDAYVDSVSTSRSYHVPSLAFQIPGTAGEIHMQTAVHKDRESGLSRVTIGFPVITVEY